MHKDRIAPNMYVIGFILPNVQDEPRPCLARPVRLGAQGVTDRVVGSGAWLGSVVFISDGRLPIAENWGI